MIPIVRNGKEFYRCRDLVPVLNDEQLSRLTDVVVYDAQEGAAICPKAVADKLVQEIKDKKNGDDRPHEGRMKEIGRQKYVTARGANEVILFQDSRTSNQFLLAPDAGIVPLRGR
jgi:hypothetical protein